MPGKILLVDTKEGRIVEDEEVKDKAKRRHNFTKIISEQLFSLEEVFIGL